jgi:hypothetical protein
MSISRLLSRFQLIASTFFVPAKAVAVTACFGLTLGTHSLSVKLMLTTDLTRPPVMLR